MDTNPLDPRILPTWEKGVVSFRSASQLFSSLVDIIEIPYNQTTIPGYFLRADKSEEYDKSQSRVARPTLIFTTGLDGAQEELYFLGVAAALKRGYNCLTFEGPGQGMVVRKQKLPFRPDWEKVVSTVIDFILSTKIDPQRIALIGYSMGGYLALRAATFDNRIAACIADDGVLSIYDAWINQLQSIREDIENRMQQ